MPAEVAVDLEVEAEVEVQVELHQILNQLRQRPQLRRGSSRRRQATSQALLHLPPLWANSISSFYLGARPTATKMDSTSSL